MVLRRTVPRLFLERQQKFLRHPLIWITQDYDGKANTLITPIFTLRGIYPALFITFLYIVWDRCFGPNAGRYHPHARFQYGVLGKTEHFPNMGAHFGWNLNLPRVIDGSGFTSFSGYAVSGNGPEQFSPFLKQYGQKQGGGHHH